MSHTATLHSYYKDNDGKLCKLRSVIGIEPEGVTEEDISLVRFETLEHYLHTNSVHKFPVKILVSVQGGKA